MDKFSSTLRGYDKEEVNAFIDNIINQVEDMVKQLEEKNKKISAYKEAEATYKKLIEGMSEEIDRLKKEKNNSREVVADDRLERAMIDSKVMIDNATLKSRKIISDAEDQADIIIKECLLETKKLEMQINILKQEIDILKQKKETLY